MSRSVVKHLILLFVLLGNIIHVPGTFAEQPKTSAAPILKHIKPKELPPAGSEMSLEVELSNPTDALRPLRLYAVRDGRPYEQTVREATYNQKEKPIYSFTLTAPLAELRYQFFLGDAPSPAETKPSTISSAVESPIYTFSRPCLPASIRHNITLNDNAIEEIRQESQEVKPLIIRSQALQEEALALAQAQTSLEGILKLTSSAPSNRGTANE